ncbi:MAG TPA: universal stress protein [Vicinamibacteria bacterium]|nr:universal stress protein [Vicinamibacteria bacterium]
MYKRILLPTDGSELSVAAIKQAFTLAKAVKAKVTGMSSCCRAALKGPLPFWV